MSSLDKWATCSWQFMSSLQKSQHSYSKPQDGLSSLSLAFLSLAIVSFGRKKKGCRGDKTGHLGSCPPSWPWHTHCHSTAAPWAPDSSPVAFPQSIPCSRQVSSSTLQTLNTSFAFTGLKKSDYLISADVSLFLSAPDFVSVSERKPRSCIKKDLS